MKMPRQKNNNPTRKVTFGAIAGAWTAIFVWVFDELISARLLSSDLSIPSEVASALTTVIAFYTAYWVNPSADDTVIVAGDGEPNLE